MVVEKAARRLQPVTVAIHAAKLDAGGLADAVGTHGPQRRALVLQARRRFAEAVRRRSIEEAGAGRVPPQRFQQMRWSAHVDVVAPQIELGVVERAFVFGRLVKRREIEHRVGRERPDDAIDRCAVEDIDGNVVHVDGPNVVANSASIDAEQGAALGSQPLIQEPTILALAADNDHVAHALIRSKPRPPNSTPPDPETA